MSHAYAQHVLKVAVAQICQTIGWHSTHTSTMDLLIDVTQHFLREISCIMHRYCELYNRTEANLDDLALAYKEIGINLDELMEYIQFIEPIPLPLEVPRFPLPKESCLNFLKPGSREVLTRSVHIPEYMPPLIFENPEGGFPACVVALMRGSQEERMVGENLAEAKRVALAIGPPALTTMSPGAESAPLDRTTGGSTETSIIGRVDDASIAHHTVINEEVEIPMQTIDTKQNTTGTAFREKTDASTIEAGEKQTEGTEQTGEKLMTLKNNTFVAEISLAVATVSAKPPIVMEEGRPTRQISSVIMTTSGFISPAREGKLPESRIPILHECPISESITMASTSTSNAVNAATTIESFTITSPVAVSSNEQQAPVAATSHSPKTIDAFATGGTSEGGIIRLMQHQSALPPPTPKPLQMKIVSEKPGKKTKKKPDKEKKKIEKNLANTPRKPYTYMEGVKDSKTNPTSSLELTIGSGTSFENLEKEDNNIPVFLLGKVAPLPPPSNGRKNLTYNPTFNEGGNDPVISEINDMTGGSASLTGPTRTPTSKSNKVAKEKPIKKRKSTVAKLPLGELGIELQPNAPIAEAIRPSKASLSPKMLASSFSSAKTKKVSKKKVVKQHQGQHGTYAIPPPLIGPLGLGTLTLTGTDRNIPDGMLGMMPNAPNTTALSHSLEKHPMMGTSNLKDREEQLPSSSHTHEAVNQVTQLNLLQMMHPSLEITASPAIIPLDMQTDMFKPSFVRKDSKIDTLNDRGVIVIDDDKTPPHVSSVILPVNALALSSTSLTTPTGIVSKKNRKLAEQISTAVSDSLLLDVNMIDRSGGTKMHEEQEQSSYGSDKRDESEKWQYFDDRHGQQFSSTAMPKTADIKIHHSSTSSIPSWKSESPHLVNPNKGTIFHTTTHSSLFSELSSKTLNEYMVPSTQLDVGGVSLPSDVEKRTKRFKPKPRIPEAKRTKLTVDGTKMLSQPPSTSQTDLPGSKNPFEVYSCGMNPFTPDVTSSYSNILNQVVGLPRIPFGMFPLPSGPGLIPDNPLFPRLPRPGFPLAPSTFGLPHGINTVNNLLRIPGLANRLPGKVSGSGSNQRDFLDEPLDPETKLAQTPLDIQKSTCNVAPLVPPSLFQSTSESIALSDGDSNTNQLLNLSVKSPDGVDIVVAQSVTLQKKEKVFTSSSATTYDDDDDDDDRVLHSNITSQSLFCSNNVSNCLRDQVVILPAASVLPGASPSQRSNMLVIDIDDSDGSQSTTTTGDKSKDGRWKQKEHKKDRKQKDSKIKKKKEKKDKSKSKDRDQQQLKQLTAGTATSPSVMTIGMIGAEEVLMEQLRKERKEKKEKRKEKLKKERRKEKETRAGSGVHPAGPSSGAQIAGEVGLKLMLKIGGSTATQTPTSVTPEQLIMTGATSSNEPRRDGSPELAKISALVTRPPKVKGGMTAGSKDKKDDVTVKSESINSLGGNLDRFKLQSFTKPDDAYFAVKQLAKANFASSIGGDGLPTPTNYTTIEEGGSSSTTRSFKTVRVVDGLTDTSVKTFDGIVGGGELSKKTSLKETKNFKSMQNNLTADTFKTTPVHMTDVDGNTVWICPACGRVDDGTPMIGCDGCDAWYHWVCVGIQVPPDDNEDWYCRVCIAKKQDLQLDEKQRKRKKKDKKSKDYDLK